MIIEKKNPLVSIILCCHKIDNYLFESIYSVLNQSYENYELIILFDNSNKREFNKLQENLKDNKNFKKIKFIQNDQNYGLTKSLNIAINQSIGKYIMRQDSDDISDKNRLYNLVNYIEKNPKINLVFTNVNIINEQGNLLKKKYNYIIKTNFFLSYNYKNTISHPCIMFTRYIYDIVDGYDEKFLYSQDYHFIHKIIKKDFNNIGKVSKYLYNLRYLKTSISGMNHKLQRRNSIVIILINQYEHLYEKFKKIEKIDDLYKFISISLNDGFQKAIYYGYNYELKIPLNNFVNFKFLFFLILLYVIHPSLLVNKLRDFLYEK